jgi:hypothetical protein
LRAFAVSYKRIPSQSLRKRDDRLSCSRRTTFLVDPLEIPSFFDHLSIDLGATEH